MGEDVGGGLSDEALNLALGRQQPARYFANLGPLAHDLERPLHLPQPAHAVEDAAGAEATLRQHEALAALTEQVLFRNASVGDSNLAVVAEHAAHGGHLAHQ